MNRLLRLLKNIYCNIIFRQSKNNKPNQAKFELENKFINRKDIKNHFDKLNLYSYFDIDIIQEEKELQIDKIQLGIIAGFAVWSGPSYSISNHLLNSIKAVNKPKMKLIIIDIDYFSIETQKKLFGAAMHGFFECILIINGEIIQRHKSSNDVHQFIEVVKSYQ